MQPHSLNTVVIGGGPVGLATACVLKSIYPSAKIQVLDKREDTTRNHGLLIGKDSVKKITELLDERLKLNPPNSGNISELRDLVASWSGEVVRTRAIETELMRRAEQLGVTVIRCSDLDFQRGYSEFLSTSPTPLQHSLAQAIEEADVLIGADGAHSSVRSRFMPEQSPEKEPLGYLIELKFETERATRRRGYGETFMHALSSGAVDFETMRSQGAEKLKPATLHINVDKETYDRIRSRDAKGRERGTFDNPLTCEEIASSKDPKLMKLNAVIADYRARLQKRGGSLQKARVTGIPLEIYTSKDVVVSNGGNKYVVLAGDSSAGVVFGRGLNKGFQEAVLLAKAVHRLSHEVLPRKKGEAPQSLKDYANDHQKLYASEASSARWKSRGVRLLSGFCRVVSSIVSFFRGLFPQRGAPNR